MDSAAPEDLVAEAARGLASAAPNAKVILFGRHARGEALPYSDLDLLVIEPEVKSRRAEYETTRGGLAGF
jgi:uncharacterized protein